MLTILSKKCLKEKCYSRTKRSCFSHSPHTNGHSHLVPQFWAIFSRIWEPKPNFDLDQPHSFLEPSSSCTITWLLVHDGRRERSAEISSLGVSVYHGISVYPDTINSQVLSYSLKPFTKLLSCVHPISQTYKSHWLASSIFFWSRTSMPVSLGAMSVFTFSTAYSHGGWSILHQALVAVVQCHCNLCESPLNCWFFLRSTVWGWEKVHF